MRFDGPLASVYNTIGYNGEEKHPYESPCMFVEAFVACCCEFVITATIKPTLFYSLIIYHIQAAAAAERNDEAKIASRKKDQADAENGCACNQQPGLHYML